MARPWKYDRLIDVLNDEELYHTSKIIRDCEAAGIFDFSFDYEDEKLSDREKKRAMQNAKSSLAHFVAKYLPKKPDGKVEVQRPYQAFYSAWYGKTWKKALAQTKS